MTPEKVYYRMQLPSTPKQKKLLLKILITSLNPICLGSGHVTTEGIEYLKEKEKHDVKR